VTLRAGDEIRKAACLLAQQGYGARIIDWPWEWFLAACGGK